MLLVDGGSVKSEESVALVNIDEQEVATWQKNRPKYNILHQDSNSRADQSDRRAIGTKSRDWRISQSERIVPSASAHWRCNGLDLCSRRISCFHAFWCFPRLFITLHYLGGVYNYHKLRIPHELPCLEGALVFNIEVHSQKEAIIDTCWQAGRMGQILRLGLWVCTYFSTKCS